MDGSYASGKPTSSGTVGEADLPVAGSSREILTTDEASPKESSNRRKTWIIVGVVVVLLAIIIGVAVGVSNSRGSPGTPKGSLEDTIPAGGTPSPTPAGKVVAPPTPLPTLPPFNFNATDLILEFLTDEVGVNPAPFDDATSPQSRAVSFMNALQTTVPKKVSDAGATAFIQAYALATFFFSTNGPTTWDYTYKFLSGPDVCLWNQVVPYSDQTNRPEGVFCNDNGEVDEIVIPINKCSGPLPDEVGLLSSLTIINMPINNLRGTIPQRWSTLSNLIILGFENNDLTGKIPDHVGGMTAMTILGLSGNSMEGRIPDSLSQMSNMRVLGLDDNSFDGPITPLYSMTNLQACYIEDNKFAQTIDSTFFSDCTGLRQLDVSDNMFDGEIPVHLFNLPELNILDMHGNDFSGPLPTLPSNAIMEFLSLHENDLAGGIPDSITNLSILKHLDLTSNQFTTMPASWDGMTDLRYLFLANNPIAAGPIPDSIQSLTNMVDLSLKKTNRNGNIPTWFPALTSLIYLDLHANALAGPLPSELGNMELLRVLLVQQNQLEGEIPPTFTNISTIDYLDFENNTFTGNLGFLCDTFPVSFFDTFIMIADCASTDELIAPEVNCTCCQLCCADTGEPCNDLDKLAQIDPLWEASYNRVSYDLTTDFNITDDP